MPVAMTLIAEAEERGDLYALTAFRTARAQYGYPAVDNIQSGRREVADVMERWSHQGFQLPHWWELFAIGNMDLYEGGAEAHGRIEARWPALAGSMLVFAGLLVVSLNMAGSVPDAADLVVTDPVQAGVMTVMAVADTAKFTVERLKRRIF